MTFGETIAALRKRWLLVLIPTLLGFGAVLGLSLSSPRLYTATASEYFSLPFGSTAADLLQGSNYTQAQLDSYAQLVTKPVVLDQVMSDLHIDGPRSALASEVTTTVTAGTVLLDISVTDASPDRAAATANALAAQLGSVVKGLSPRDSQGRSSIDATVVASASPPTVPTSPKTTRNVTAGLLAGLLVGLLLALGWERLDNRVRSAADLEPVPTLAAIMATTRADKVPLLADGHSRSRLAEGFRRLRTNIQFVGLDQPPQVIVVTSAVGAEGKSLTAANLAIVFAGTEQKVLLIEADMRQPRVAATLGVPTSSGLSDVLAGQVSLEEVLHRRGDSDLTVLPCGSLPPNPSELLGGRRMRDVIAELRLRYSTIIIDTPPLLPVTDAAVLAVHADGVLLVVRSGRTTGSEFTTAVRALQAVDARLLGVVLNMVPRRDLVSAGMDGRYGYFPGRPRRPRAELSAVDSRNASRN